MKNVDYTVERMRRNFARDWHVSSYADEITGHRSMTKETQSIVLEAEYENATNFSVGATTDNLPPGVLYRVKATYKYNREDVDELSFDVGEIIRVVEYDDPEEQVCDYTESQCLSSARVNDPLFSHAILSHLLFVAGGRLADGH